MGPRHVIWPSPGSCLKVRDGIEGTWATHFLGHRTTLRCSEPQASAGTMAMCGYQSIDPEAKPPLSKNSKRLSKSWYSNLRAAKQVALTPLGSSALGRSLADRICRLYTQRGTRVASRRVQKGPQPVFLLLFPVALPATLGGDGWQGKFERTKELGYRV